MPDIAEILTGSLTQRWRKYLRELRRCKRTFSEESVHDLRVATRRMISTLLIYEVMLPDKRIPKMRRRLKRLFDTMSPLRDTQVQLLTVEEQSTTTPELLPLITVLKMRERSLLKSVRKRIRSVQTAAMGKVVSQVKKELREQFSTAEGKRIAMTAAFGAMANAYSRCLFLRDKVNPRRPATIHAYRVAFKKFRYNTEAMSALLPGVTKKQLKAMDAYQTHMGNVQDVEVLGRVLQRFMRARSLASRRKLGAYKRFLQSRKRNLIAEFLRSSDELQTFWHAPRYPR